MKKRQRTPAVAKDEADIRVTDESAVENEAHDGPRAVEHELERRRLYLQREIGVVIPWSRRMDKHHGFAAIELVHDRRKRRIAGPPVTVTGTETDPVRLQDIEAVGGLTEAALHVEQRERGEEAKPVWMIAHHLRGELIAVAGDLPCLFGLGYRDGRARQDRGGDTAAIHRLDRPTRRPRPALGVMMMRVDAMGPGGAGLCLRLPRRRHRRGG